MIKIIINIKFLKIFVKIIFVLTNNYTSKKIWKP
jgi:hypothetical protein